MIGLDLNNPLIEEDDETLIDQLVNNEPFVGQTFSTFEEVHIFYKNYANQSGFSIRKDRFVKKNDIIVRRDLYCHRGGKKPLKEFDPSKDQRNRESIKCECNAHLRITLKKSFDIFPDEWHVTTFIKDHNHELLSPEAMRFLPVNRTITQEDEENILLYKSAGLDVRCIIRVMELKKQVKHGDLPFLEKDVRNLFAKVKKMSIINHMKLLKQENVNFQYVYTVDEERRLESIFWCHPQSFEWYANYGDVVVLDTTYKVKAYDMPCALFVGINNHGNTVLFGSALLRNETMHTFTWLMKTFITIMKKPPKTIITDQDPWMSKAIETEMPTTKHSYCIWHITTKFSCWFTSLLRSEYQSWCSDFYMLYRMACVEEFEHNWKLMVKKYNLENNKHVLGLYDIRKSWAPTYLRDNFFGGMTSTSRSESINAFIKKFVSSQTSLKDFVSQVDLAVEEIRKKESHNMMLSTLKHGSLKAKSPLEEQAFKILTPFAFKKFQEEFQNAWQYLVVHVEGNEFIISYFKEGSHKKHKVFWDGNIASCSCKNFEFWGILCRHIFRVLNYKDCFNIPPIYLPLRWCSNSFQSVSVFQDVLPNKTLTNNQPITVENIPEEDDVLCPPKSTTKGRPRKRRLKGGKELANKKSKTCSICKESGHTKPTCHNKENMALVETSSSNVPRKKCSPSDIGLNPIFTLKC